MTRRGRHRRVVAPPTRLGASEEGDLTASAPPSARRAPPAEPAPSSRPGTGTQSGTTLPTRASEDTDEAWGEHPEGSDDARYLREKPPHWS